MEEQSEHLFQIRLSSAQFLISISELLRKKTKATSEGNISLLISTCIDLAEYYFKNDNFESCIAEYKILAERYKELHNYIDYARANRRIGEAYMQIKEYNKALMYQEIYLQVAVEQNNKLEEQRALATIGHTYLMSYSNNDENSGKSSLKFAYKFFKRSLLICER